MSDLLGNSIIPSTLIVDFLLQGTFIVHFSTVNISASYIYKYNANCLVFNLVPYLEDTGSIKTFFKSYRQGK